MPDPVRYYNRVIIDYEAFLRTESRILEQFYVAGALRYSDAFLKNSKNFGWERRPGVVHYNADEYDKFSERLRRLITSDAAYIISLLRKWKQAFSLSYNLALSIEPRLQSGQVSAQLAVSYFDSVSILQALSHLKKFAPVEAIRKQLLSTSSEKRNMELDSFNDLLICTNHNHFQWVRLKLLELALLTSEGAEQQSLVAQFCWDVGYLQTLSIARAPFEDPEHVTATIQKMCMAAADRDQVRRELAAINSAHTAARVRQSRAKQIFLCGGSSDSARPSLCAMRAALVALVQMLVDEEELRRFAIQRAVRNFRELFISMDLPIRDARLEDLLRSFEGRQC